MSKTKKKVKRRDAEAAADLLLEEGGMAKLDRDRLKEIASLALRQEAMNWLPGYITFSFVNHGDGCWSVGDSFTPLKQAADKLTA